jgi:hypothetical protein
MSFFYELKKDAKEFIVNLLVRTGFILAAVVLFPILMIGIAIEELKKDFQEKAS